MIDLYDKFTYHTYPWPAYDAVNGYVENNSWKWFTTWLQDQINNYTVWSRITEFGWNKDQMDLANKTQDDVVWSNLDGYWHDFAGDIRGFINNERHRAFGVMVFLVKSAGDFWRFDALNNDGTLKTWFADYRDSTYLLDIKSSPNGWDSEILIRNTSDEPRDVTIGLLDIDGNYIGGDTYRDLAPNATWPYNPLTTFTGSAVVAASESVAVVVVHRASGKAFADNSFPGSADPLLQTGTTLFAPAFYNAYWNWNSTLTVLNTGPTATNVTFTFKGRAGYGDTSRQVPNLPAGGSYPLSSSSVFGSTEWVGSVVITATQPLAVRVDAQRQAQSRSYNAMAAGNTPLYLPAAYKNMWGITSGLVVQNTHASQSATVELRFYDRNGNLTASRPAWATLDPHRAAGLFLTEAGYLPASWTGSVHIVSRNGPPLAATSMVVNAAGDNYEYNAASSARQLVILPYAARNVSGRTTGYTVQNPFPSGVQITAYYYDDVSGSLRYSEGPYSLPPYGTTGRFQSNDPLPDGWQGSIVLEANGPVVAIMREDSSDTTSGYNGIAR